MLNALVNNIPKNQFPNARKLQARKEKTTATVEERAASARTAAKETVTLFDSVNIEVLFRKTQNLKMTKFEDRAFEHFSNSKKFTNFF